MLVEHSLQQVWRREVVVPLQYVVVCGSNIGDVLGVVEQPFQLVDRTRDAISSNLRLSLSLEEAYMTISGFPLKSGKTYDFPCCEY